MDTTSSCKDMKRFTVSLQEDEYGDLILPIPEEVIDDLGWELGDELQYIVDGDTFLLKKYEE